MLQKSCCFGNGGILGVTCNGPTESFRNDCVSNYPVSCFNIRTGVRKRLRMILDFVCGNSSFQGIPP